MGRPISETDCTGWPSPTTPSGGQTVPEGATATGRTPDGRKVQVTLKDVAEWSGWTTPAARDWKDSAADISTRSDTGRERFDQLPRQAVLTGWPTPTAKLAAGGEYSDPELALARVQGPHANDLRDFAKLTDGSAAGWNTPTTNHNDQPDTRRGIASLAGQATHLPGPIRLTHLGQLLTGSGAGTVSGGQLNPDLSRWLMGLPEEWARSMPGWQDWQMWQVLTELALNEPKPTE